MKWKRYFNIKFYFYIHSINIKNNKMLEKWKSSVVIRSGKQLDSKDWALS